MALTPIKTGGGLQYGPTTSGKMYLSAWKHRATRNKHKSFWSITFKPEEEYALFDRCDEQEWLDAKGAYWGLVDGGKRVLGALDERLGYFPPNGVTAAPWHGYPVSSADVDYVVPDVVIDVWVEKKEISNITAKRIRGGKL